MKIRPAVLGNVVRDPRSLRKDIRIPDDGAEVDDDDIHWAQRLRDGDIVRCDGPLDPVAPLTTR